ncbi:MAG TPA: prefoldin subunit alpha [Methanothermococcus okinawensis]|uniref:Prefoldin subunit alpha n=1 Tax=Methanothermococcus okinawensis TaxID=155863 RepID=A0A832YSJ1_9EURY|nr:prefoldin subunit alpha [Methanothermococcus okinawensis]
MNEEIQKQLYQLELYNQQVNKLQEELEKIELMRLEVLKSIESMDELKNSKELLVPLGGGAFVKAEVVDCEKIIVGAGADVFVEKSTSEVVQDFKKYAEELNNAEVMLKEQISKTISVIKKLQNDLESKAQMMEQQPSQGNLTN